MIRLSEPHIGADEREAVARVLTSGQLVQGPEVAQFESDFAAFVDGRHCIAVNSGTAALHLGLLAAGVQPGDEVIVPSFTFAATANAVRLAGCVPVFADVEEDTFCLSASAVAAAITPRTTAIVTVHLYGQPATVAQLRELADRHGLLLVEDAAQAHGASYAGVPAGAWGQIAAFSFYATKNVTTGEGGVIVTPDLGVARRARLLRNQGMEERYRNEIVGFNARMTEIAAAIGRVQLTRLNSWNQQRRVNAATYDESLQNVSLPVVVEGATHVYHQYTIRSPQRDRIAEALRNAGIDSGIYYRVPVHRLPAYDLSDQLPVTDKLADEVLSLPVGPHLGSGDIARVCQVVNGV